MPTRSPRYTVSANQLNRVNRVNQTYRSYLGPGPPYLGACLGVVFLAHCATPFIVDPQTSDGGSNPNTDGGIVVTSTWRATPAPTPPLYNEVFNLPQDAPKRYREWKRDPHYFVDSGTQNQYVYFSGSMVPGPPSRLPSEKWSIVSFMQTGNPPSNQSMSALVLSGQAGSGRWDGNDLTAPFVLYNPTGSPSERWMLWYAANGDPARPSYVTQIGLATSSDGNVWMTSSSPAISTPTFSGTDANATPATARPDAYGLTDPWVLVDGSNVYMYYAGLDCSTGACKYQILRSTSPDGGRTFPPGTTVFTGRAGVTSELGGVAGPSVVKRTDGTYLLAYTAVASPPVKDRDSVRAALTTGTLGFAMSNNGTQFTVATASGMPLLGYGPTAYSAQGSTSPSLYLDTKGVHAYFGGYSNDTEYGISTADLIETKK